MNFLRLTPGYQAAKTAGQKLVQKLGPNWGEVAGTIGPKDIQNLKFTDMADAVKGIKNATVKVLPNGDGVIKLKDCCHLQHADSPKNVTMVFNKDGDCLSMTGIAKCSDGVESFTFRSQEGIDSLLDAGVKNPASRRSYVRTNDGTVFVAENNGKPAEDCIIQAYEYPYLGKALKIEHLG